jgi:hypothetical protein
MAIVLREANIEKVGMRVKNWNTPHPMVLSRKGERKLTS